jgi:hypothetical protein
MTVARKLLEIAAFWEQDICLDCETIQPPPEGEDEAPPCVKCGSGNILAAETVLQIADMVEGEEE